MAGACGAGGPSPERKMEEKPKEELLWQQ